MTELAGQTGGRAVTHLVVAAGSLGTVAGLILGTWATGMRCDVHGYSVLWPEEEAAARLDALLTATREHHLPGLAARPDYRILGTQLGSGYGMATKSSREAARTAIRQDGMILNQTYTAKAMAGLIQGIRDRTYTRRDTVVFFHIGGLAGFFAEDDKELS